MTFQTDACKDQLFYIGNDGYGFAYKTDKNYHMTDKILHPGKLNIEPMLAQSRQSSLVFENQNWQLNLRIAYDDDFATAFGANAEERLMIIILYLPMFIHNYDN